eukprot:Gb_06281 [translate_table: standard]
MYRMGSPHLGRRVLAALTISCFLQWALARHTNFTFNRFHSNDLRLSGIASIESGAVRLTNNSFDVLGHAIYPFPVRLKNASSGAVFSFSTTFVFCIVASVPLSGQGMAFFFTPFPDATGGQPGQYLGLFNATTDGDKSNRLFAVEFDTDKGYTVADIDGNHVGIDINSVKSTEAKSAGYWTEKLPPYEFHKINLQGGNNIQAWIDYDSAQKTLNITLTPAGMDRPSKALISHKIDLRDVFQERMFLGFSASTASHPEKHYVLAWSFNTNAAAQALDVDKLPNFSPKGTAPPWRFPLIVGSSVTVVVVVFTIMGSLAFCFWKPLNRREFVEKWELEFWPHRFTYKELSIATKGFSDEELVGFGGFGRVYKGVLQASDLHVAVKCISHESKQGMSEFIAEISSIGRLQHRNLAQLRGWCRRKLELFLVYDYMPNGSLDKMIYDNATFVLPWPERYKVLKGVASGLLYLHEEWEQTVVHRDVKASNVLLDREFNGKLGDFGLARLYQHGKDVPTTLVAGTPGYIAPELTRRGKATTSADVFSFGILLLEVACGRRPVERGKAAEEEFLVDWVWNSNSNGHLLEVADKKLNDEYVVEEMEKVLKLGLICSHPKEDCRPSMRQVVQILEGDAPLPLLPSRMPSFIMGSSHEVISCSWSPTNTQSEENSDTTS